MTGMNIHWDNGATDSIYIRGSSTSPVTYANYSYPEDNYTIPVIYNKSTINKHFSYYDYKSDLYWKYPDTNTKNYCIRWDTEARQTETTNYQIYDGPCLWVTPKPVDPKDRLREIIRTRSGPGIIIRRTTADYYHLARKPLLTTEDIRELRARETLRRVLGEMKFRSYLKDGFVCVRAKSGLVYQIFPGHGVTAVYNQGKMVERLCVVLQGNFPPTDSLIMRYLLILNDEERFRSKANKHRVFETTGGNEFQPADQRSLVEIYQEFKNPSLETERMLQDTLDQLNRAGVVGVQQVA